jgi:hypothetical protein
MFIDNETGKGTEETVTQVTDTLKQADEAIKAFKENVLGPDFKGVFQNIEKQMISISDKSIALQRNMGGVAANTGEFQNRLVSAYKSTIGIGATFDDVAGSVQGLADGMGRMVSPSEETITNMVTLSKVTGMSTKEIGGMVSEMVRFGGTEDEAVKKMAEMGKEARISGLNGKQYTEAIGKNLTKVSGFGFKSGVDGMSKMVKQAMLLRTNIESIGALSMKDSILEPEGAITMAAEFQMLGGAVGKLADPFQLMYMAQNDMEGLQNELVNSTKAAMTFNAATGKFDVSTQDMYRLRQQAKLTGANLEDLVNTGREAAKLDFIKEKFDLSNIGLAEDQKALISNLATIGEGGKLTVDIPGLGKPIIAENPQQLQAALQTEEAQKALAEYSRVQGLTDKQLAENQLTISQRQAADINEIKFAVLSSMSAGELAKFTSEIKESNKSIGETIKEGSKKVAPGVGSTVSSFESAIARGAKNIDISESTQEQQKRVEEMDKMKRKMEEGKVFSTVQGNDMFLSKGDAPAILKENTLYKGIVGDEVAIGTNLTEAFNKSGRLNEIMSTINTNNTTTNNTTQSVEGKIDININLNGSISGDKNSDVEKIFSDPKVQKHIMDTVIYKLDSYKKQQGVLS